MSRGTVYLLHFERPIAHAQHYLGYAKVLEARIAEHRAGGPHHARVMEVVVERGVGFDVVRTWRGGRTLERKLKNQRNVRRLCPVCRAAKRQHENDLQQKRRQAAITDLDVECGALLEAAAFALGAQV